MFPSAAFPPLLTLHRPSFTVLASAPEPYIKTSSRILNTLTFLDGVRYTYYTVVSTYTKEYAAFTDLIKRGGGIRPCEARQPALRSCREGCQFRRKISAR